MAKYHSEEEALKNYDTSKYRTPDGYTSDIAIFTLLPNEHYKAKDEKSSKYCLALMLIKRAGLDAEGEPNIEGNKWALPGGFTQIEGDKGSAFESAKRELLEETSIKGVHIKHFGVYDTFGRDKRGWIISNAHYAIVPEQHIQDRRAADDAAEVQLFTIDEVFKLDIAFDHRQIIEDAISSVKKDMQQTTVAKNFLPEEFKLEELRQVLLAVIDDNVVNTKSAFFRKAPSLDFIEEAKDVQGNPKVTEPTGKNKRPSKLYKFEEVEPVPSIWN